MKLRLSFILVLLLVGIGTFMVMPGTAFAGTAKVDVCHFPPGNPENFHTIRISEKALDTHLAHGDLAGACNVICAEICDDGDACTVDDTGDCADVGCPVDRVPVVCDDGLHCTTDSCNPSSGCIADPVVCTVPDLCTISVCSEADQGACIDTPVSCSAGEECNPGTGFCEVPPCVDILAACAAYSEVLETFCGFGTHDLTAYSATAISYVILKGSTNSVVLNHCVDSSALSGQSMEVFDDTNLCSLEGACCGDPRWNDKVCSVEIK